MPRATRSRKAARDPNPEPVEEEAPSLPEADRNPLKLFILPKGVSKDARIICLNEPVRSRPTRYLHCPQSGFYEFTKISTPHADPRSWMLQYEKKTPDEQSESHQESKQRSSEGYIAESQDLFVATPFDPVFFLIPILSPPPSLSRSSKSRKDMFLTLDDHVDEAPGASSQFKQLLRTKTARLLQNRLKAVCDTVEVADEIMFRLSLTKTAEEMMARARKVALNGLPKSMEEHFVSKPLEPPVQLVKTTDPPASAKTSNGEVPLGDPAIQIEKDQTAEPSKSQEATVPDGLTELQRTRTALDFITRSYLPPRLQTQVKDTLSQVYSSEFAPLDTYMAAQNAYRAEAQALRAISDNIIRKRSAGDDEAAELRAEKKRKKEEEDVKRKTESRAMKELKKVDTTGMKKISSFFTKGPAAKAKA